MIEPRTLPGFMELLPQDQILFNSIQNIIKNNYEKFGFLPLDTPILENSDVLLAKAGGETEKQIYEFTKGDSNLCLRFDLTVPLAKYVAANFNELSFPFARYQIGKVYRGERPQKGRFREFYQCDIDVIGKDKLSLIYDAEIPSVIYNIFKELNIGDFVIKISNRKLLFGLLQFLELEQLSMDILRVVDKIEKIGIKNFISTLKIDYKLEDASINKIVDFVSISGSVENQISALEKLNIDNETFILGLEEIKEVSRYIKIFGVSENNFCIDLSIARGLDYYTGTVYETFIKGKEFIGSISSGGRFENLAGFYTEQKLPGVGMSIGLTRLFYVLKENNMLTSYQNSVSKAIIIPMGDTLEESIKLSSYLRDNNVNNVVYLEDAKFKTKMNYASKSNIKYAVFVGEDEVKNNYYTIKNLQEFTQEQVNFEKLLNILKK